MCLNKIYEELRLTFCQDWRGSRRHFSHKIIQGFLPYQLQKYLIMIKKMSVLTKECILSI